MASETLKIPTETSESSNQDGAAGSAIFLMLVAPKTRLSHGKCTIFVQNVLFNFLISITYQRFIFGVWSTSMNSKKRALCKQHVAGSRLISYHGEHEVTSWTPIIRRFAKLHIPGTHHRPEGNAHLPTSVFFSFLGWGVKGSPEVFGSEVSPPECQNWTSITTNWIYNLSKYATVKKHASICCSKTVPECTTHPPYSSG